MGFVHSSARWEWLSMPPPFTNIAFIIDITHSSTGTRFNFSMTLARTMPIAVCIAVISAIGVAITFLRRIL